MSNMDDPLFRTQDWASQQRWRGQEAESSALGNIGSEASNTVRYLQQLGQRQQELDLRTQQWQVERQIQMQKLAEMQAIDQADGGRLQVNMLHEQVRQLKVHNDIAEHALERSKQNVMTDTEQFMATHWQGTKEMLDLGIYVPDAAAPGGYRRFKDDAEREKWAGIMQKREIERIQAHTRMLADPASHYIAMQRNLLEQSKTLQNKVEETQRALKKDMANKKLSDAYDAALAAKKTVDDQLTALNNLLLSHAPQATGSKLSPEDAATLRGLGMSEDDLTELGR